jgi:hypothetical protein
MYERVSLDLLSSIFFMLYITRRDIAQYNDTSVTFIDALVVGVGLVFTIL